MAETGEWLRRLRTGPATAAVLRSERKRISRETVEWDRAAVLRRAHDLVVKATSWALRELAKRDPAAVRRFLVDRKDELAARVIREGRNKLETGRKIPAVRARRAV